MNFKVEKRIGVRAPSERIWEIVVDLPRWDRWNPVETGAAGTIGFGGQISLTERIEGLPERQVIGRVAEWQPNAQLVWTEKRGLLFNTVRFYEIEELEPGSCIVSNGFIFSGLRGEGFHERHRRTVRNSCEAIAEALRITAEG
ncbi:MAG: SRPBCC domain-containing protein [Brevundimonas sp.]|uniref:SRPBCC domain-containing protein n=1 Tax=Brevundimonas sp. TaxID=1871086 RepID=UPI002736FE6B|nr:SRPBCC domain-containing protein [Brevundimonas sp.]MBX9616903.1 SRPBCC domain-containing protein [Caulobacteraceae bacterium]MDP3405145.1 SRPBCC domain-containing protein [Brevundimonas sp.]